MIPTVKVRRDGPRGWHIIRQSDFDPARHVLYEPESAPEPDLTDAELREAIEAATGERVHHKTGRAKLLARYREIME